MDNSDEWRRAIQAELLLDCGIMLLF